MSDRYEIYTLIHNKNLNDLSLKLFDNEKSTYYDLNNLDKFWIVDIYPINKNEFLVQYQNEWQRNHLVILTLNENDIENSEMKLLFKDDAEYAFQESLINPIIELSDDKLFLYGVNLRNENLEAYSISIQ